MAKDRLHRNKTEQFRRNIGQLTRMAGLGLTHNKMETWADTNIIQDKVLPGQIFQDRELTQSGQDQRILTDQGHIRVRTIAGRDGSSNRPADHLIRDKLETGQPVWDRPTTEN